MKVNSNHSVVIVAGGKGLRVGADIPKQFLPLAGKPMLMHTIEKFYQFDNAIQIIVVLHQDYTSLWENLCKEYQFNISCEIVKGGETRFESVKNGLDLVLSDKVLAIHDAARPFVTTELITKCYQQAQSNHCGIIPVVDEKNSLRLITDGGHKPLDRTNVKVVQTPQVFPASLIKEAYNKTAKNDFTDDATVAENNNVEIQLIGGDDANIKITTSADLNYGEYILRDNN